MRVDMRGAVAKEVRFNDLEEGQSFIFHSNPNMLCIKTDGGGYVKLGTGAYWSRDVSPNIRNNVKVTPIDAVVVCDR